MDLDASGDALGAVTETSLQGSRKSMVITPESDSSPSEDDSEEAVQLLRRLHGERRPTRKDGW